MIDINVKNELKSGLKSYGITKLTDVQNESIPVLLSGKDLVAKSKTGSGKTFAYLLPILEKIDCEDKGIYAIIITPTHELCAQVKKEADLLIKHSGLNIRTAMLIGNTSIVRQIEALKEKPHIVVGTSGRMLDLIEKKKLKPHTTKIIVLDEGDKLLDSKNIEQTKKVIKTTLKERQLALFSATVSKDTKDKAVELMKSPVFVNMSDDLPSTIKHIYVETERRQKTDLVRKIVAMDKDKKTIIFLNDKENIEVINEKLTYHNIKVSVLYGTASTEERRIAISDFKDGRARVLIASDMAARGLDTKNVDKIINFEMPEISEFYLHRAGRTGRMDNEGLVVSLCTTGEIQFVSKHEKRLGITIEKKEVKEGKFINA